MVSPSMLQTLLWMVLFVGGIAFLPWFVRRWQQGRSVSGLGGRGTSSVKVLSAVAVGPQQRVITVEVGPEDSRICLVLGVTVQQIQCLYVLPHASGRPLVQSDPSSSEFAREVSTFMAESGARS